MARPDGQPLRHSVALRKEQQSFRLEDERIENERPAKGKSNPDLFYHYYHGRPVLNTVSGKKRALNRHNVAPDASILCSGRIRKASRKSPAWRLSMIASGCTGSGRSAGTRCFASRRSPELANDRLEEDFSKPRHVPQPPAATAEDEGGPARRPGEPLRRADRFRREHRGRHGPGVLHGRRLFDPATRLSDGTVRYLCLLAILCDPRRRR